MDETTKRIKPGKKVAITVLVSGMSLLIGAASAAVVVDRGTPSMQGMGTASSTTMIADPPGMERRHVRFPECGAMHAVMSGMMGSSGMMGGSDMVAHHPSA